MTLQSTILRLEQFGLTDVLLPFALIFTIMYAVSATVPHLKSDGKGDNNKKLRVIVSLVISLMVVIPHVTRSYPYGLDVVEIINGALPQVVMLIIAVVMVLILLAATLGSGENANFSSYASVVRIASLAIVGLIFFDNINFGRGYGFIGRFPRLGWFSDPDLQAIIVIIIVFGLIVYFITGDGGSGTKNYGSLRRSLEDAGMGHEEIKKIIEQKANSK